jgi:hypothetical protein
VHLLAHPDLGLELRGLVVVLVALAERELVLVDHAVRTPATYAVLT